MASPTAFVTFTMCQFCLHPQLQRLHLAGHPRRKPNHLKTKMARQRGCKIKGLEGAWTGRHLENSLQLGDILLVSNFQAMRRLRAPKKEWRNVQAKDHKSLASAAD